MIIKSKHAQDENTAVPSSRPEAAMDEAAEFGAGEPSHSAWLKRLLLGLLVVGAVGGITVAVAGLGRDLANPGQQLIYHTVKRGDLPITVTERGNLESQQNEDIVCEVDDIGGDNINGTPILWVVSNGASVKEGDLLVEFDSAKHQERLDRQILDTEQARSIQVQAQAKHENQITQNKTNEADAALDVQLANLELEMFNDPKDGTHELEVQEIDRQIEDIDNEIKAAEANLLLKENDKRGIESLYKLGYAGKSELDRSRLDYLQAEGQFAAKVNKLKTQLATRNKKTTYEKRMEELRLTGKVQTAERKKAQVERNSEALLAHAEAVLRAANESLKKEEELLERYGEQVEKCKIYAPQDGMVAYATSYSRYYQVEVREGAPIRPQQKILSLPNLDKMQVKTSVHESVLDQIKPDLQATIRVDAFPDQVYQGTIQSVAVLPAQTSYWSTDTKVYETIVTIDEEVKRLKPGMTAVVEIHVDRLEDVLTVPVQAIVQIQRDTWCYVDNDGTVERRTIKLGLSNDKFVEIQEGLQEGERVVLNPMAIIDETEEETDTSAEEGLLEPAFDDPREAPPKKDAGGRKRQKPRKPPKDAAGRDQTPKHNARNGKRTPNP